MSRISYHLLCNLQLRNQERPFMIFSNWKKGRRMLFDIGILRFSATKESQCDSQDALSYINLLNYNP